MTNLFAAVVRLKYYEYLSLFDNGNDSTQAGSYLTLFVDRMNAMLESMIMLSSTSEVGCLRT